MEWHKDGQTISKSTSQDRLAFKSHLSAQSKETRFPKLTL